MQWIDWFFVGVFGVAVVIFGLLRMMSSIKQGTSGASTSNASSGWVVVFILLLIALMVAIAMGKIHFP